MVAARFRVRCRTTPTHKTGSQRYSSSRSPSFQITPVNQLPSWDLKAFRAHAFNVPKPAKLPFSRPHVPPACRKWFIHTPNSDHPSSTKAAKFNIDTDVSSPPQISHLAKPFWLEYASLMVPLELTVAATATATTTTTTPSASPRFIRTEAPLEILLTYLDCHQQEQEQQHDDNVGGFTQAQSIYLAQHSLPSLPSSVQNDIPTPDIVLHAGKGDIYDSSLWLGRSSTSYTPLHRDPNPNILLQLAGRKVVRLLPPEVGDAVFESVRSYLSTSFPSSKTASASAFIRGDEMMAGPERDILHRYIWGDRHRQDHQHHRHGIDKDDHDNVDEYITTLVTTYCTEAHLGLGEAIFIPKGWWHSVRGEGTKGVTASANWWFR